MTAARVGDSITVEQGDLVEVVGNAGGRGPLRTSDSRVRDTAAVIGSTDPRQAARGPAETLLTGMFALEGGVVAGDSGGALLNRRGQVVAMILAYTPSWCDPPAGGCGGYAIPINHVLFEGAIGDRRRGGLASPTLLIPTGGHPAGTWRCRRPDRSGSTSRDRDIHRACCESGSG